MRHEILRSILIITDQIIITILSDYKNINQRLLAYRQSTLNTSTHQLINMAFPYMNTASPQCRPIESYTTTNTKGPDPLSDNWSYDSAIDLFTLNTMMPDTFALDLPEDMMNLEPKEFANVNPFSQPPGISGFAISDHSAEDSVSCGSISSVCYYHLLTYSISVTNNNNNRTTKTNSPGLLRTA